uniref:Uncharacterized protein n=1 Tax=Arundo donax TaxID=35708 RepID=A0A0A9AEQ5_ARUDO
MDWARFPLLQLRHGTGRQVYRPSVPSDLNKVAGGEVPTAAEKGHSRNRARATDLCPGPILQRG